MSSDNQELQKKLQALEAQVELLSSRLPGKQSEVHSEQEGGNSQNGNDSVNRMAIKLPPFWPDEPELWFSHVETQFTQAKINQEATKYTHVVAQLERRFANEVKDVLRAPPQANPYTHLKNELIQRLSVLSEAQRSQRVRHLISEEKLNGQTPSQFLRRLQSLADGTCVDDGLMRSLWLQQLPVHTRAILLSQPADQSLDQQAQIADRIIEVSQLASPPLTSHVTSAAVSDGNAIKNTETLSEATEAIHSLTRELRSLKSAWNPRSRERSQSRGRSFSRMQT